MKKICIPVLILIILTITGCGNNAISDRVPVSVVVSSPPTVNENTEPVSLPEDDSVKLRMAFRSSDYQGNYYDALIAEYNDLSNITVQKLDYGDDAGRLMLEFASGDGPDLIMSFSNDGILSEKDCLIDLYPFLDNDPEVGRESFANLDMLSFSGKLTRISPGYMLVCPFGLSSSYPNITRDMWTFDLFMEAIREIDTPKHMTGNQTGMDFLLCYTLSYIAEYVDYIDAKCDFETELFYDLLDVAQKVDSCSSVEEISNTANTYSELFNEYPYMIRSATISGTAGYSLLLQQLKKCDPVFLGYPTLSGGNAEAMFITSISGCSVTEHPNEVWDFIKYVLTADSVQQDTSIFPVFTSALERQLNLAVSNYNEENANDTELGFQEALALQVMDADVEIAFSQDHAELIQELLYSGCMYGGYDGIITPIIMEETVGFFAGDKTKQEAASLIQNRVQIYLSEQQ